MRRQTGRVTARADDPLRIQDLTQGAINGIIGYTPGRTSNLGGQGASNVTSGLTTSELIVCDVAFTPQTASLLLIGTGNWYNGASSGSATGSVLLARLTDSAGNYISQGVSGIGAAPGGVTAQCTAFLIYNVTPGTTYRVRLVAYLQQANSAMELFNPVISAISL